VSLILSGTGDVLEPEDGIIGIGSAAAMRSPAARGLIDHPELDAEAGRPQGDRHRRRHRVFTNDKVTLEKPMTREIP